MLYKPEISLRLQSMKHFTLYDTLNEAISLAWCVEPLLFIWGLWRGLEKSKIHLSESVRSNDSLQQTESKSDSLIHCTQFTNVRRVAFNRVFMC